MLKTGLVWVDGTQDSNFEARVEAACSALKAKGISAGKVAGLRLTGLCFLTFYQACHRLGATVVILSLSQNPKLEGILDYVHVWVSASPLKDWIIRVGNPVPYPLPPAIAVICRSSGTTGHAKYIAWHTSGIEHQCQATCSRMQYDAGSCFLITLPLYCSYGLSLVHIWQRNKNRLTLTEAKHPKTLVQMIETTRASSFHGVPQVYASLLQWLNRYPGARACLSSVRVWDCGGDRLTKPLAMQWLKRVGLPILDGYGLTEAGPNVALNGPTDYQLGTVGKPLSAVELKIMPDKELWVRSPSALWGTLDPLRRHLQPFQASHWLPTGDLAGQEKTVFLNILGRKHYQFVIKGWNISPESIEETLLLFPGVVQVGVTAVTLRKDLRLVALVNLQTNRFPASALRAWCAAGLPAYCIPGKFFRISRLPTNANGKLDRRQLSKIARVLWPRSS